MESGRSEIRTEKRTAEWTDGVLSSSASASEKDGDTVVVNTADFDVSRSSGRGVLGKSPKEEVLVSRAKVLYNEVNNQDDVFANAMLGSKEAIDKRKMLNKAFRVCKDAFMEIYSMYLSCVEDKRERERVEERIVGAVTRALGGVKERVEGREGEPKGASKSESYAAVVQSSRVRVPGRQSIEVPKTTSFYIVPSKERENEYESSSVTRETLQRVFKPSECALKINRVSFARKNAVRIEALSPDMQAVKQNRDLRKVGLEMVETIKYKPRMIIYGIRKGATEKEIEQEILLQNFSDIIAPDLKVIYIFAGKSNWKTTNCIIEVSPQTRRYLLKKDRVYVGYSSCRFADHVRVFQCYRCLEFGH